LCEHEIDLTWTRAQFDFTIEQLHELLNRLWSIRGMAKRFVLIDRDGTLVLEKHYLSNPAHLKLIPGAAQALSRLQKAGWGICVVTNQSGIARGYFDASQLDKVHKRLAEMLARFDVKLDGIYLCPHGPDDKCNCRKPLPGMILEAVAVHGFNPRQAWVIGDKEVDVGLGHAVGAKAILVRTGYGKRFESDTKADLVADDLAAGVDQILDRNE
jgi:D-glycero-D-manno-heptose 1,7-bisphosphate phosphatase